MRALSLRLKEINGNYKHVHKHVLNIDSLNKKYATRQEFDKTIGETENAFVKVCPLY